MNDDLKENMGSKNDPLARTRYWLSKSTNARMAELERLRQEAYGYDPATIRLERVLEITDLITGETQRIDCRQTLQRESHENQPAE